ncbi:MAG: hypothetical protein C4532_13540 [Candidatus Abyssobacteria bacterium SURF_17]|uniref:Uncharacterized protein n=1 Tax=Candidatus Abyssobacteria bacterium SURF_17 TaxID=2093361 RepID=A0A419EUR9_9BACT|nr:MAG: hypothetical protein C4532_13540 [Candidatus Abyssubacteria bacterium SURF_17]
MKASKVSRGYLPYYGRNAGRKGKRHCTGARSKRVQHEGALRALAEKQLINCALCDIVTLTAKGKKLAADGRPYKSEG